MEIGIYGLKRDNSERGIVNLIDKNAICIVNAIYRSRLTNKWNTILARKYDPSIDRTAFINKYKNFGEKMDGYYTLHNKNYYYTLLEYLCHNHRGIEKYKENDFENSDTIFYSTTVSDEEMFLENNYEVSVVSEKKSINVGEKYFDKDGKKVFVLGIVRTDIDEDFHTVIIRHNIDEKFNEYIDYDHDQFGTTPDFYNCLFMSRKSFLAKYKK